MLTLHPKRAPRIHWHVRPESWAGLGKHKAKSKVGGHIRRVPRAGALGGIEVPSLCLPAGSVDVHLGKFLPGS